jgi:hypothetical protein
VRGRSRLRAVLTDYPAQIRRSISDEVPSARRSTPRTLRPYDRPALRRRADTPRAFDDFGCLIAPLGITQELARAGLFTPPVSRPESPVFYDTAACLHLDPPAWYTYGGDARAILPTPPLGATPLPPSADEWLEHHFGETCAPVYALPAGPYEVYTPNGINALELCSLPTSAYDLDTPASAALSMLKQFPALASFDLFTPAPLDLDTPPDTPPAFGCSLPVLFDEEKDEDAAMADDEALVPASAAASYDLLRGAGRKVGFALRGTTPPPAPAPPGPQRRERAVRAYPYAPYARGPAARRAMPSASAAPSNARQKRVDKTQRAPRDRKRRIPLVPQEIGSDMLAAFDGLALADERSSPTIRIPPLAAVAAAIAADASDADAPMDALDAADEGPTSVDGVVPDAVDVLACDFLRWSPLGVAAPVALSRTQLAWVPPVSQAA